MKFLLYFICILNIACIGLSPCKNKIEKEMISPSGKYKVVIYDRGCGATVGFITGISVLPVDQNLTDYDKANVLLAEYLARDFSIDKDGNRIEQTLNFDAAWDGDNEITVFYTDSELLTKRDRVENIEIKYKIISK